MNSPGKTIQVLLRRDRYLASLGLVLAIMVAAPLSEGRNLPEPQVKAAFLFNFAAFVNWPDGLFHTPDTPLRYCTLDADAVSRTLEQLIAGETLDGRPLELVRLEKGQRIRGCHILFLGAQANTVSILSAQRERSTLTVGDTEDFLKQGGMIALLRKRKRIHPVINLDALEVSSLRLSSKLLRLATRVRSGQQE